MVQVHSLQLDAAAVKVESVIRCECERADSEGCFLFIHKMVFNKNLGLGRINRRMLYVPEPGIFCGHRL